MPAARAFIPYARKDGETFATALRERLEKEEPEITLWQDRARMEGGVGWWKQVTDALDDVEFMILVVTPASLASDVVQKEWRYARQQGVCVYPVNAAPDRQLDFAAMPRWMSTANFFDLDKSWATFVQYLKSPCDTPRVPFMAPDVPAHGVERAAPFGQLLDALLDPSHANPRATTIAVHGSGGFGKTTLATQLCHHDDVITAFVDGILWATLGEKPNALAELTKLYAALTGERPEFVNEDDAAIALDRRLADRHCLLVIDDVWDPSALRPFLRGGTQCARLITTRQLDVALEAKSRIAIDEMTAAEATRMLASFLDGQLANDPRLAALAQRMGEWPILLELAGGALKQRLARGDSLDGALIYLNRALDREGVVAFDRRKATERGAAVTRTIAVSLDLLTAAEREQYQALAVFPEDAVVPVGAVSTLLALDPFDTEKLLETLDGLSLLRLDLKTAAIRLHDVMRTYLAIGQKNAAKLHARLADAWSTTDHIPDAYAWRYVAYHMAEALTGTDLAERHERTKRLVELVTSTAFREKHLLRVTDIPALRRDLDLALQCTQRDEHPDCPTLVARAAIARSTMIELDAEQLFALARDGKLDKSEALLTLFDPDEHWRFAALVMLAWSAATAGHDSGASALIARLTTEIAATETTLQSLLQYVRGATVPGAAFPPSHLPAPPDLFTVSEILQRLGGTSLTPIEPLLMSGLAQLGDGAPVFLAEHDGPLLVAFAHANPAHNATYVAQYIAAQSSNPYRYYRDRSLWSLVPSIVQCDDPQLTFALMRAATAGALAPTRIDFRSALPLVVRAIRARAGDAAALEALEEDRVATLARVGSLSPERGEGDPWAQELRRLVALAEVYHRVLDRPAEATALLDTACAMEFRYNFAGFRAPACLTVAESMRVCLHDGGAIGRMLESALAGAQNIQDLEFCAQTSARVNAMRERWWPAAPAAIDIVTRITRLAAEPNDPVFAPVHRVGDTYALRSNQPSRVPLPQAMRDARTLREVVNLYPSMRAMPEAEVLVRNPQLALVGAHAFDQPLPVGTLVHIMDDDFAPLIAARLAAEALVADGLPAAQRATCIRHLVPIASSNATALDTVLARSLMTSDVQDLAALDALAQAAEALVRPTVDHHHLSHTR